MEYAGELVQSLWPLGLYLFLVTGLILAMLIGPALLGGKRRARATNEPYESGVVPATPSGHFRIPIPFYLMAIFFVIFDLEAVFLFAWAIALKPAGWTGFIEAVVFILVLLAALVYLWRLGALDWRTPRQKRDLERTK